MTTMFSIHAQDALTAALSAIEVGVDTATGRKLLDDAHREVMGCMDTVYDRSLPERATLANLATLVGDLRALANP